MNQESPNTTKTTSTTDSDIEPLVRARLRSLREAQGWSLDELAARTHLNASTISRIETGKRAISLGLLQSLCRALNADMAELLDVSTDDADVVIRPVRTESYGRTVWPLTRQRPGNAPMAAKMLLEPTDRKPEPRVHPGHDWFFVLSGTVLLTLGEREILVHAGEAADFSTMTPHAFACHDGPAEVITIFDRDGQLAHMESES